MSKEKEYREHMRKIKGELAWKAGEEMQAFIDMLYPTPNSSKTQVKRLRQENADEEEEEWPPRWDDTDCGTDG